MSRECKISHEKERQKPKFLPPGKFRRPEKKNKKGSRRSPFGISSYSSAKYLMVRTIWLV